MFHPDHKNVVYLDDKVPEEELTMTGSPAKDVKEGTPSSGKICSTTYPGECERRPKRNRGTLQDPNDQSILENETLKKADITSDSIGFNPPIQEAKAGPNTGIPSVLSTLPTDKRKDSEAGIRIGSRENDTNVGVSRNEYYMRDSARCLGEEDYNTWDRESLTASEGDYIEYGGLVYEWHKSGPFKSAFVCDRRELVLIGGEVYIEYRVIKKVQY